MGRPSHRRRKLKTTPYWRCRSSLSCCTISHETDSRPSTQSHLIKRKTSAKATMLCKTRLLRSAIQSLSRIRPCECLRAQWCSTAWSLWVGVTSAPSSSSWQRSLVTTASNKYAPMPPSTGRTTHRSTASLSLTLSAGKRRRPCLMRISCRSRNQRLSMAIYARSLSQVATMESFRQSRRIAWSRRLR